MEGIFAAPEGAASLVAYQKLLASGFFTPDDTVVLFNTGSGLKYLDVLGLFDRRSCTLARFPRHRRNYRAVLEAAESPALIAYFAPSDADFLTSLWSA